MNYEFGIKEWYGHCPIMLIAKLYKDNALHKSVGNDGNQQRMIWALPKIVACKFLQKQCLVQNLEKWWRRSNYAFGTEVPTSGAWRGARCEEYSHSARQMRAHVRTTFRFAHAVLWCCSLCHFPYLWCCQRNWKWSGGFAHDFADAAVEYRYKKWSN